MIHEYYKELQNNQNIRENLSLLRSECKDPQARETLLSLVGDGALLTGLLESDEPKVRKNAALLLGSLGLLQTAGSLFHAYEREQTLFVRSAYLTALSGMEVSPYLEALKEHRDALLAREIPENEKKHVNEELRELERIITAAEGITRHTFVGFTEPQDFLLATNREQRGVTLEEVKAVSASVRRSEKLHPLGVLVHAKDVRPFASIRTYRELLFPVRTAQPVPEDAVGGLGFQSAGTPYTGAPGDDAVLFQTGNKEPHAVRQKEHVCQTVFRGAGAAVRQNACECTVGL